MTQFERLAAIFLAGGVGTLSRYGLTTFLARFFEKGAPWSVATVNVLGCFGFGVAAALLASKTPWSVEVKTLVLTGFFGAFTTFSTYAFDLFSATKSGEFGRAFGSFAVQNGFGIAALALGFLLTRRFYGA